MMSVDGRGVLEAAGAVRARAFPAALIMLAALAAAVLLPGAALAVQADAGALGAGGVAPGSADAAGASGAAGSADVAAAPRGADVPDAPKAVAPGRAALAKVKSPSARAVAAKAGKVGGAAGYEFKIAADKAMTKAVRAHSGKVRMFTFKGLEQGKRYYVRVRAWAEDGGKRVFGAWSKAQAVRASWKPVWRTVNGYYKYRLASGKSARGLVSIQGKTYLFDSRGHQKVGWQRYRGTYRFFDIGAKSAGAMAAGRVVNGIALARDGAARYGSAGAEELALMVRAQQLAEQLNKPGDPKAVKLRRGFDWMRYECVERGLHAFGAYPGWHRVFARDILVQHMGSCFSYGAAMAYYANAIGCQSCMAVSSGGHGWAEIDGKVYDVEWSRVTGATYFAWPYGRSGAGAPNYAAARAYVVQIAPNAHRW